MSEDLITPETGSEYTELPGAVVVRLMVPMICPECTDIHFIQVTATAIPKEGGLVKLIEMVQSKAIEAGMRIPTKADIEVFTRKVQAELEKAEGEKEVAETAAKASGAVYIPRQGRPGGDA